MAISKQKLPLHVQDKLDVRKVFYKPAVLDTIKRGQLAEIKALIKGAKEVKAEYGDIDGLIARLEDAASRAK
jgi:hypothetical protein